VIITSLAPSHKNKENQLKAIESWRKHDTKIVSVNHISEIKQLKEEYNVEFIEPGKTGVDLFGRHYVPASELLKVIKKEGSGLIINSDIIIKDLPKFGINPIVFNRYDFNDNIDQAVFFRSGFDAFYLKDNHCDLPETRLCLGQCHWDYWLPIMLLNKGFSLERPVNPHIYHKRHELQYSILNWKKTAQIFGHETGIRGSEQSISQKAFSHITGRLINI